VLTGLQSGSQPYGVKTQAIGREGPPVWIKLQVDRVQRLAVRKPRIAQQHTCTPECEYRFGMCTASLSTLDKLYALPC
jgi:hypothetical protein